VCLLIVASRLDASMPLVVAANRDERLDRPAMAMAVLQEQGPRILGGRDLRAGGTWLAVNERGVVAGLTNTPTPAGRDESKRSRGELPMIAARHPSAAAAVAALVAEVRPEQYNPAWMLVGDRRRLFAVTVAGDRPAVAELAPGVHVLENRPPGCASPKASHVRDLVGAARPVPPRGLVDRLTGVLADHSLPPGDLDTWSPPGAGSTPEPPGRDDGPKKRPVEIFAACVHTDDYGTRSSVTVQVPTDAAALPVVAVAAGPPCRTPFSDASFLWHGGAPAAGVPWSATPMPAGGAP
jgi:uncharacterized protein with NRDE domain